MTISNYNLIKFVLASLEDHKIQENPNWITWTKMVLRVYNNRMPKKVLLVLSSSDIQAIKDFASNELLKNSIRSQKTEDAKKLKYDQWIKRRDDGNTRANNS